MTALWPTVRNSLCRQCHPNYGDCFHFAAWLNDYNLNTRAGMEAAADWLTNGNPPMVAGACSPKPTTPRPRPILTPPAECWQQRAADFVAYAQEQLWTPAGRAGLDYLLSRGLTEATIKAAGLGFNPQDYNDPAHKWAVTDRDSIWLPGPGIVIPWAIDGSLHRVNIRLLKPRMINGKERRYIGPAGWRGVNPLYNADDITPHKPVLLVEGELCALTAQQEAGDLITAAATGAKDSARGGRWIARLAAAPLVLLAFDAEPGKGDEAARPWLKLLTNARRWRPAAERCQRYAPGRDECTPMDRGRLARQARRIGARFRLIGRTVQSDNVARRYTCRCLAALYPAS